MATEWLEKFIDNLAKILREPPYLLFTFIGGIFVIITLISRRNFEQTWIFLLYSVGGTMWRYAERDFLSIARSCKKSNPKKYEILRLILFLIYHFGNFGLFLMLLHYLKLIQLF